MFYLGVFFTAFYTGLFIAAIVIITRDNDWEKDWVAMSVITSTAIAFGLLTFALSPYTVVLKG